MIETKIASLNSTGGVLVTITHDATMFNISQLYNNLYRPSRLHPEIWRLALHSFMISPVVRGVMQLLDRETVINVQRTIGGDLYLHIGLLSLAFVDLGLVTVEQVHLFHLELRDMVTQTVSEYYSEDRRIILPPSDIVEVANDIDIGRYSNTADRIISLATTGQITLGGVSSTEDDCTPWLVISTAAPSPSATDIRMIIDVALQVVYTALAAVLAKRSSVYAYCQEMLGTKTKQNRQIVEVEEPWDSEIEASFASLLSSL